MRGSVGERSVMFVAWYRVSCVVIAAIVKLQSYLFPPTKEGREMRKKPLSLPVCENAIAVWLYVRISREK